MNMFSVSSISRSQSAGGLTRFSLVRILLATLAVCLPVALVLICKQQIPDKAMRVVWPPLLAALLGTGGYVLYLRIIEQRAPIELSSTRMGRELGAGVGLGTLLFLSTIAILAALGCYQFTASGNWGDMVKPFAEMAFVALIEEILFRGILFRLLQRALNTWGALVLSSILFALAHLPNAGITLLAVGITAAAGMMLAAAYLATGRLWLGVGLHFAWNYLSDGVFSFPTSSHPAKGLVQGRLSGPEWLGGGAYGVEGSVVSLLVIGVIIAVLLRHASRRDRAE